MYICVWFKESSPGPRDVLKCLPMAKSWCEWTGLDSGIGSMSSCKNYEQVILLSESTVYPCMLENTCTLNCKPLHHSLSLAIFSLLL